MAIMTLVMMPLFGVEMGKVFGLTNRQREEFSWNDFCNLPSDYVTVDTTQKTIDIKKAEALTLLSNCPADRYCEYTIAPAAGFTGSMPEVKNETTYAGKQYAYQGLGTKDHPYKGIFKISKIKVPLALFDGISSEAEFPNGLEINCLDDWAQNSAVFAENYVFADRREKTLTVKLTASQIRGAYIGEITGESGTLNLQVTYPAADAQVVVGAAGNAGLLCNTLSAGTLDVTGTTLPVEAYTVSTENGAAGGIVGEMKQGTALKMGSSTQISVNISGTRAAGGFVGACDQAAVSMTGTNSVSGTITGRENAGGVIGKAEHSRISVGDALSVDAGVTADSVTSEQVTVGNAGGVFGYFSTDQEFIFDDKITIGSTGRSVKGITAGGLVGVLVNDSKQATVTIQGGAQPYAVNSALEGEKLGGLIGQYSQKNGAAALHITKVKISSGAKAVNETSSYGGLIGLTADQTSDDGAESGKDSFGYISIGENVSVSVAKTDGSRTIVNYGGLIGEAGDEGYFLDLGSVRVTADGNIDGANAGGLVGNLDGGVLRLQGVTDLSGAEINGEGDTKGQLVGARNNALVYALGNGNDAGDADTDGTNTTGWTFQRSAAVKVSDIGSYGEVYRPTEHFSPEGTDGLLTWDAQAHTVTVAAAATAIASVRDFAAVAVRAQLKPKGAVKFTGDTAEDAFNFYNDQTSLSLTQDIDLTGTGITGFMRDNGTGPSGVLIESSEKAFQGTFSGDGHTITLGTGEAFGTRKDGADLSDTEGCGKIYRHSHIGLFAVTAGARIRNVKMAGTMKFDSADMQSSCGAVVAQNIGADLEVSGSTTSVDVSYSSTGNSYVGGLVGRIYAGEAASGTMNVSGNTVSGSMAQGGSTAHACMGGLVAYIDRDDAKKKDSPESMKLDISSTTIRGLSLTSSASSDMGGFLGYEWQNVAVTLQNITIKADDASQKKASLTSRGTAHFGGMVYKATGYWTVSEDSGGNKGIDIRSAAFTGNNTSGADGMLVYLGRHSADSALYLEIQKNAYQIGEGVTVTEAGSSFDELVGKSFDGTGNGQGVVSYATSDASDDKDYKFNTTGCTTYANVTKKGSSDWTVNSNTRYYYNLDGLRKQNQNVSGNPDNAQQLVLWSVGRYAAANIKQYFCANADTVTLKQGGSYDMGGYSFYPTSVEQTETLTFDGNGATITFDNSAFNTAEDTKSSTKMKTDAASQHSMLHYGLFRDYKASGATAMKTYTLTVKNLTLTGNIGHNTSASGVILCGEINGGNTNNTINTHSVILDRITLQNLRIAGYADADSAPLCVNSVGSYTSVSLSNIKASYKQEGNGPAHAAGSLMGNAGGDTAQNISMSFGSLAIQDGAKAGEKAMFSKAVLLNSFVYPDGASCAAVYNFDRTDDWQDTTWSHHNVTYGKEISDSTEYKDQQHWYYDSCRAGNKICVNKKSAGGVEEKPSFSAYLPYVGSPYGPKGTQSTVKYHEIKVNVYVVDIIEGCGTYGHPFRISTAEQMVVIAEYIRTGTAGNGRKIRCSREFLEQSPTGLHDDTDESTHCAEYVKDGDSWKAGTLSISNDEMQDYMRNAYYQITENITLDDSFVGLGYDINTAFRGVIVGKKKSDGTYPTIYLQNDCLNKTTQNTVCHGLISNSYGSVVMNLNIHLSSKGSAVEISEANKLNDATVNQYFGGVIGQILGGDNVIENVSVQSDDPFINLTGRYKHLVPVGGYVGIVQGGTLIFRNIQNPDRQGFANQVSVDGNSYDVKASDGKYFYINPYIGRVLDGCAFYEQTGTVGSNYLNNTDKNYQIATIDPNGKKITTSADSGTETKYVTATQKLYLTTTVRDAQSLLILSAIANSGAGGGGVSNGDNNWGGSYAYLGKEGERFGNQARGKARNASYKYVGQNTDAAKGDFASSVKDDHKTVKYALESDEYKITDASNTPYLVTKYTDPSRLTYFYAGNYTRVSLTLSKDTYDMSKYTSGYRGIGGRYKSASVQTNISTYNADRNTPFTNSFDGGGSMLQVDMNVNEYADDNYHAIGIGGLYNVFQQDGKNGDKNITNEVKKIQISGKVRFSYRTATGEKATENLNKPETVGVGGLVGRSANRGTGDRTTDYYADISGITLKNLSVSAPYNAGGMIGLGGVYTYAVDDLRHSNEKKNNIFAAHFTDCQLENVTLSSDRNAGGLIGWSAANVNSDSAGSSNSTNRLTSCTADGVTVTSGTGNSGTAGVFLGKCDSNLTLDTLSIKNSGVNAQYSGLAAGWIRNDTASKDRKFSADNVMINSVGKSCVGTTAAGGIAGKDEVETTLTSCVNKGTTIQGTNEGGLIGELTNTADIYGCKSTGLVLKMADDSAGAAGAFIGKTTGEITGGNLLWDSNSYEDGIPAKGTWIAQTTSGVSLAGVSRKNTLGSGNDDPLPDVGSPSSYKGYISYADYCVKNDYSQDEQETQLPKVNFDNGKIKLYQDELINLGKGNWCIQSGSEYVSFDQDNSALLKALKPGTAVISDGKSQYTVEIAEHGEPETILEGGTYADDGTVKNGDGSVVNDYIAQNGTIDSSGLIYPKNVNGSILQIKADKNYIYTISCDGLLNQGDGDGPRNPGRMRIRLCNNTTGDLIANTKGYMSVYDKDSWTQTRANYYLFEGNKIELSQMDQDGYIWYNYDYFENAGSGKYDFSKLPNQTFITSSNPLANEKKKFSLDLAKRHGLTKNDGISVSYQGYKFKTDGDKKLFSTIKVEKFSTNSLRTSYDKLIVWNIEKRKFPLNTDIGTIQNAISFALLDSKSGAMMPISNNDDITFDSSKVKVGSPGQYTITAKYKGKEATVSVGILTEEGIDETVNVITSPKGRFTDGTVFSGAFGTLLGDAVYNAMDSGSVNNNVDLIYQEMKNGVAQDSGRVKYTTTGVGLTGTNGFDVSNKVSTFHTQNEAEGDALGSDFRVLLAAGNSIGTDIRKYLDLLTNGGYSLAMQQGKELVDAKSETYRWNGSEFEDTGGSSLIVKNSAGGITYSMGKDYDNDRKQFTLLTVTFKAGTHTQTVYVPIVVRRIVEIDFCATLNDESIFTSEPYDVLKKHVLVEYDADMTGYLSWIYNSSQNQSAEFDWQSFMESGADLTRGFDKKLIFDCSEGYLPAGSRITLVDTQNQDIYYTYKVQSSDINHHEVTVPLSAFVDREGKNYQETAVSRLYHATATVDNAGRFIEAENAAGATVVTTDGRYYRLKNASNEADQGKTAYSITLDNAQKVSENYYVVVNVPEKCAKPAGLTSINGALASKVDTSSPCNITQVHRYDKTSLDDRSNTESTYSILSSYTQKLEDQSNDGNHKINTDTANIDIHLKNTISFNSSQSYDANTDKLYQEFIATPYNNKEELSFLTDSGTSGTVSFMVYSQKGDTKQYYNYQNGKLVRSDTKVSCASYPWTSEEGKMKLVLGTVNSESAAIDLSPVRTDILKSADKTGDICVEAQMTLTMSKESIRELVPASIVSGGKPEQSLHFQYNARLASSTDKLTESTWRASTEPKSFYYKDETGYLELTFNGDNVDQLGINLNDLPENRSQVINATAVIDFNNWTGWKSVLEKVQTMKFTFHLEQKENSRSYKKITTDRYLDYVKAGVREASGYQSRELSQKDHTWTFTQTKAGGSFANLEDGVYRLPVEYAVDVSTKQTDFMYANYRLVAEVTLLDKEGNAISVQDKDNPSTTSLSDYVTYTLARVLTNF